MSNLWNREPAMVVAFVQAVIGLAVVFGLELNDTQNAAIVTVVALGLGLLTRSKVTPVPGVPADG